MKVCIVRLGYVGLPLAIQFARSDVIGLDVERAKVDQVNRGRSYIKHIAAKTIGEVLKAKGLTASTDFGQIEKADTLSFMCRLRRARGRKRNTRVIPKRRVL